LQALAKHKGYFLAAKIAHHSLATYALKMPLKTVSNYAHLKIETYKSLAIDRQTALAKLIITIKNFKKTFRNLKN
jgi:hypothetical protein